MFLHKTK